MSDHVTTLKVPLWFWGVGAAGLAWNIFGVVQFLGAVAATPASLAAKGMTPEQAAVYLAIPLWMNAAFAVSVFGGAVGSLLLLTRHAVALPVLATSFVSYCVLFLGDITQGVFAALGAPQITVMTAVVLIAAGLWRTASLAQRRAILM